MLLKVTTKKTFDITNGSACDRIYTRLSKATTVKSLYFDFNSYDTECNEFSHQIFILIKIYLKEKQD